MQIVDVTIEVDLIGNNLFIYIFFLGFQDFRTNFNYNSVHHTLHALRMSFIFKSVLSRSGLILMLKIAICLKILHHHVLSSLYHQPQHGQRLLYHPQHKAWLLQQQYQLGQSVQPQ